MSGMFGFPFYTFFVFIFPFLFTLVFIVIILNVLRGTRRWHYNNQQPILTVTAKVVAKRSHVSHHVINDDHLNSGSTSYYVTFEVESGSRFELHVPDQEYGLLVEGDCGKLTFQGNRFHKFERENTRYITTQEADL